MRRRIQLKIILIINILYALGLLSLSSPVKAEEDLVPDMVLRQAINNMIGHGANSPVTKADLESLSALSWSGESDKTSTQPRIKTLQGLQYAVNLQILHLNNADLNHTDSIAPIQSLTNITSLSLNTCKISDESLKYITNLTNLEFFSIYYSNIKSFRPMAPFFAKLLAKFRADPETQFQFSFNASINDFRGLHDYITYIQEYAVAHFGMTAPEAKEYSTYMYLRGMVPTLDILYYYLDPQSIVEWNHDLPPIKLDEIWVSKDQKKESVTVAANVTDQYGEKALFFSMGDWKQDIDQGGLGFLQNARMYEYFYYLARKTNGYENENVHTDTPEDYFTLKQRQSKKYPGTTEYYYEGRDFSLVPYNPYSKSKDDIQDAVSLAYDQYGTVYYYEFKNFKDKIPLESGDGFYPTPYSGDENTTNIVLPGLPFVKRSVSAGYNSGRIPAFQQTIHWVDPASPYLTGMKDQTIGTGTAFDPMKGVKAFDPARDGDNSDGKTPTDITSLVRYSGSVNTAVPGKYVLQYRVTNPYGKTATGKRMITVVNVPHTDDASYDLTALTILLTASLTAVFVFLKRKIHMIY